MLNDIKKDATTRMNKSVEAFRQDLTKLRTGRATTAIVDHLKVNYYGSDMPLNQVATVAVQDARSLTITPWEKAMVRVQSVSSRAGSATTSAGGWKEPATFFSPAESSTADSRRFWRPTMSIEPTYGCSSTTHVSAI